MAGSMIGGQNHEYTDEEYTAAYADSDEFVTLLKQ